MITEEDFTLWRLDPVTRYVFALMEDQVKGETQYLAGNAGKDPSMDCLRVGRIQGMKKLLEIRYDD